MFNITEEMLQDFAIKFIHGFTQTSKHLENKKMKLSEALPEVLVSKNVYIHATYTEDKRHVFLRFNKGDKFHFKATQVRNDISNIFDPFNTWKNNSAGMRIMNTTATLQGGGVSGMRPFIIDGDQIEVFIKDYTVDGPPFGRVYIEYGLILSYSKFIEVYNSVDSYVAELTGIYLQYNNQKNQKIKYMENMNKIKEEMKRLFFDEKIGELEIDSFIEKNPIILSVGLRLDPEKLLHTKPLENIHNINPKRFEPDLIAYCFEEYIWKIIDYKKAKRSIINNPGRERTHFKADVAALVGQLEDYTNYFNDHMQKKHFNEKYQVLIDNPVAVGIIGQVAMEEISDFNKLKRRLHNGLEIVPYNFLYDRFVRFMELNEKAL